MSMTIAITQLNSNIEPEHNWATISKLTLKAAKNGANIISFPEVCNMVNLHTEQAYILAHYPDSDVYLQHYCALIAKAGLYAHLGSCVFKDPTNDGKLLNRTIIINPKGNIIAHYDKIHMFDVTVSRQESYCESRYYTAGTTGCMVDMHGITCGLSICYDIRFPILYRQYRQAGAKLFFIPAAFTNATGQKHWAALLRARAIENSAYVVASCQVGTHEDGRKTYGHSMVINPWGDVIAHIPKRAPGLSYANISAQRADKALHYIPAAGIVEQNFHINHY